MCLVTTHLGMAESSTCTALLHIMILAVLHKNDVCLEKPSHPHTVHPLAVSGCCVSGMRIRT
jgi:hypothetical protein